MNRRPRSARGGTARGPELFSGPGSMRSEGLREFRIGGHRNTRGSLAVRRKLLQIVNGTKIPQLLGRDIASKMLADMFSQFRQRE